MKRDLNRLEGALVSVVIPNYNHAAYIGDAIRSILDQIYRNFEIIVVDDGSTDESREVISKFSESVKYLWQNNKGLSGARNTGIRAAKGDYIGLLDADDLYEPQFLSTLLPVLIANPDADGVFCGYRFVDPSNNPLFQTELRYIAPDKIYNSLLNGNFFAAEAMIIRRRCYEKVGLFDETLRACEDWDMWLRITKNHQIIGIDKILTRIRVLPGSMSSDPARMINNRLIVLNKHLSPKSTDTGQWTTSQRRAYGHAYLRTTIEYLQIHNMEKAYDCLVKMVCVYPELLEDFDTYYELACGDQPKGIRGVPSTIDMERNETILFELLTKIFCDPIIPVELNRHKLPAFANAYLALGFLSYGNNKFKEARKYWYKAIKIDPKCSLQRRLGSFYAKSYVKPLMNQLLSGKVSI